MFGGASEGAVEMGAAECDVFAIYAEPRATTAARITEFRARAETHGRSVGFNMSVRPIIAPTEGAAWDKAHRILAGIRGKLGWARQESESARAPVDNAGRRQFAFAQEKEVHDERLWMGITRATGALGNTSCLVGTPEQVAASILGYYRLGVSSFLMRGFDPIADAAEFGRELIPRIKAGAAAIDMQSAAASTAA